MRIKRLLISAVSAAVIFGLAGCDVLKKQETSDPTQPVAAAENEDSSIVSVETTVVRQSSFTRKRTYVGNIAAAKSVKVIPLASERILKFPWENGDFVEKGQIIAEIRNEVSKKGLEAMNAQIKSVDAQLKAAERELKRVQSMYESNIATRQNYDQAQDGVTTLLATKQQLLATQEQTKMGLDYARVVAPISGVISGKNSEVGDIASSAMPLCVLNDMETLKVTLNVNEGDMQYLRVGQDVILYFDAYKGEKVIAKITRILPYVNTTTRTNTVEAEFPNVKLPASNLYKYKPGMYSRAELSLETTNDAITIPPKAMILDPELLTKGSETGEELRRVFVVGNDNKAHAKEVSIGEYNGDIVQILRGLEAGDKLIIRGQHSLREGDDVREYKKSESEKVVAAPTAVPEDQSDSDTKDAPAEEPAPVEGT